MNFLVTGATGFIGSNLVGQLLAQTHSVSYLGRKRSRKLDSRAAYFHWDYAQRPPVEVVPRPDTVVHLAGEPIAKRWTSEIKKRIYESRVHGTKQLVSAIGELRHKPNVLISASAIGYYGDRGDEILTESSGLGAGFLSKVCADWEKEALRAREFGLRVVQVRFGVVLGRNGGALPRMSIPFRLGLGGRLGDGKQWMSWIHVHDLVRLIQFIAENASLEGPVNGVSPQPVTNANFTRTLAQAVHRPAIVPAPKFALKIAFGEMATFLFDSLRVMPQAITQAGFEFRYPELSAALRELTDRL